VQKGKSADVRAAVYGCFYVCYSLKGLSPYLFFVGAAIESSMADEIWDQLKKSTLKCRQFDEC